MITVVAGLIEREGNLLACQRRRHGLFPLKWEFPGGKVQPGETPERALARELHEELGVTVATGREVYRVRHQYRELSSEVELIFFAVSLADDALPQNLAFAAMEWVPRNRLKNYDFLPADQDLIEELTTGRIPLRRNAGPK